MFQTGGTENGGRSVAADAHDRRKRRVRLTASGHALLKRAYPPWCEAHAALEQEFCDAATLRALLQQVVNRTQTREETAR